MKKALTILALTLLAATAALADTVSVTSKTSFSSPSANRNSMFKFHFKGTRDIVFTVAGKTCTLKGSGRGHVPKGCNYDIVVAPDGSISGKLTTIHPVCTQSDEIPAACK